MAVFLLDTNIIIDALNKKKNRGTLLEDLLNHDNLLACCPINIAEVYAGLRADEETDTEKFLESLRYYPITWSAARLAGFLKRDYSKKGKTLSVPDTIIAAVAIENGLLLITDNVKDYPMKEVKLYPLK